MPSVVEQRRHVAFTTVIRTEGTIDGDESIGKDPSLALAFENKVRPYIDLVDELRYLGLEEELELPAVVVIGDQSSGKSSILEAISGIQLPRGSGIVTRCPLEMRLKKTAEGTSWTARASYKGKQKEYIELEIAEPQNTEKAIRTIQNEIAGENKGISHNLITLHVDAPNCPDLTLIDLPGIARTAVEGQPADISDQIKALLKEYCKRPQTIMLCVIPANVDIAVNEALTLAREFDPTGSRTLGVLTKPDLVDEGTEGDILEVLNNEKFYLKKGYSIVRCRGQKDINDGIGLREAIRQENKFFETHKVYRKADPAQRGTTNLALKLTDNLVDHIRQTIPKLREDVRLRISETQDKLAALGEGPPTEVAAKRLYYTKLAHDFLIELENVMKNRSKVPGRIFDPSGNEILTFWVSVSYQWRKAFETLKETVESFTYESFDHGEFTAQNIEIKRTFYRGRELPRYVNFEFFETLVQEHLENYTDPINRCLEAISLDLVAIIDYVSESILSQYPNVMGHIRGICEEVHKIRKIDGKRLLRLEMRKENLVYSQDSTYLNHLHDFMNADRGPMTFLITSGEHDKTESSYNADVVQQLLKTYLVIVNRRMMDNIPMLLRTTQHDEFIETLQERVHEIACGDQSDELICESVEMAAERKYWMDKNKSLQDAMKMLSLK